MKSRILTDNIAFRATFTASQTEAGFQAQALGNYLKDFTWKSLSAASRTVSGSFSNLETANMIYFPFTNLTSSAQISINFYSAANFTGLIGSISAATPFITRENTSPNWNYAPNTGEGFGFGRYSEGTIFFTEVSFQSLTITIQDTTNPSGFLEISSIVLGKYNEFNHRPNVGIDLAWETEGQVLFKPSGASQGTIEPVRKVLTFDMGGLDESERRIWTETFRTSNSHFPIYFGSFPENSDKEKEHDYEIYGFLAQSSSIKLVSCPRAATSIKLISC